MKQKEGERCERRGTEVEDLVEASLQCKEDLVCAPSVGDNNVDYKCQESVTKIESFRYCGKDSDCGYDATCQCNDIIGRNVCVPVPSSSKKLKKLYTKFKENDNDLDTAVDFYEYLVDEYLYIHAEFRCQRYFKKISAASSLKASALATIALAFLALF